jgi:hypothetical protein
MDERKRKLAEKRIREGWIKSTMIIEVLAVSREAAESALSKHVEKMEQEDETIILDRRFHETREVEKPMPRIEKAYSRIVDVDALTRNFDQLVRLVVSYAPSSIEILEPERLSMDMGEAQGILNSIAEIIHKFAAAGLGGVMVST